MRKIIFGVLALAILAFYYMTNPSANNEWLYGSWNIDVEIEKTVMENFTFKPDGTITVSNSDGIVYNDCTYELFTRNTIDITCNVNGKKGMFPLEVNFDNSVITMTNGNKFKKSI